MPKRIVFVYRDGIGLGIGYLSSHIKRFNHEPDLVFEHNTFSNLYINIPFMKRIEQVVEDTLGAIVKKRPDIVGFSVAPAEYQWALGMSRRIKEVLDVPIIFGGYHPTLLPELCMENREVDMICRGEGEEALAELLNSMDKGQVDYSIKNIWFKKNGEIIKNPIRPLQKNLDDLSFPDRDLFLRHFPDFWKHEIGFVLASRGCPFSCSYCANAAYNELYKDKGSIYRLRSPANVIEECVLLKDKYRVKKIHFRDDLFGSDTGWLGEFIPEYKRRVKLPFTCLSHPRAMTRRNVELLKEGDCRLAIIGIQSGSERLRRDVFNRRETNEDIRRFAGICRENKLSVSFNHIFDAPTDSEEEIFESARLYNDVRPQVIDSYVLVYFPKAEIIKQALAANILTQEDARAINEGRFKGLHQAGFYGIFGKYYQKYAMSLALLPLFPRVIVNFVLKRKWLIKLTTKIPIRLMPVVKTILNFKCGSASFHYLAIRTVIYRFRTLLFAYWKLKKGVAA
jgi:radical SAM superfamily enzyme YgiQ (UPF0313 family)